MRRKAIFAVIAIVALLAGCSSVRFVYDNADTLLRWQMKSYLDLHGEQVDELDARIGALLAWHRRSALPEYARLAADAAGRVEQGLSRSDLEWGYDAALAQVREAVRAASAEGAGLFDRLTEEQIAHLESRIAEDNRKFARERLKGTPPERRKRRAQRVADRLEEWVGSLNDAQIERITLYSARAPLVDDLRDRDQRRRQAELLSILRAREAKQRLAEWAAGWERGRAAAYVDALVADRGEFFTLLLDLDRSLSADQRSRAAARFNDYAADFARLASGGAAR